MSQFDSQYAAKVREHAERDYSRQDSIRVARSLAGGAAFGGSFLDFGCGSGRLLEDFAKRAPSYTLFGVDVNPHSLRDATQRVPYAHLSDTITPDMHDIDIVAMNHTLPHLDDPLGTLQFIRSRMKYRGVIGVLTFNPRWEFQRSIHYALSGYKGDPTVQHRMTARQLRQCLSDAGFVAVQTTTWGPRSLGIVGSLARIFTTGIARRF